MDSSNKEHLGSAPASWQQRLGIDVQPQVFIPSVLLIVAVAIFGAGFTDTAEVAFTAVQSTLITYAGWFYILCVATFLIFVIGLGVSRYGTIKLGPDDATPDYSYGSWIAMLFSAGMGIGLMFYSVAEPILHFDSPPVGEGGTVESARQAMDITFFHWGLHAWAIYITVGLSLAYFAYRHDLPLTLRSALYPIIGDRIYGWIGHTVDIVAVLGTMFGVATSLGLGVMQVNAGLNFLTGLPESATVQLGLIAVITLMATGSVVLGLDRGIRRLSEINLLLGLALVGFVFVVGPTLFLVESFVSNVGNYLQSVVPRTFDTYPYADTDWQGSWTLFYWAWWIAWSPFVGMFIARISRGRTIREFILAVLFVPTAVTFFWLTVFGDTALYGILETGTTAVLDATNASIPTALFTMLDQLPLAVITSIMATFIIVTFFVTSSDSGSLVIDIITSGGDTDPPVVQRVFWAVSEGIVASVLLVAGGLSALQTAALTTALPFAGVLLLICYGLLRGLQQEKPRSAASPHSPSSMPSQNAPVPAASSTNDHS